MSKLLGDIKINIILRYATVVFNFVVGIILARILTPEDFGLVAIAYIFYNVLATIGDMGLGTSIVQYNQLKRKDVVSIYVFTIIVALVISMLLFLSSFLISDFYQIGDLIYIVQVFSLSILFYVINNIPASINRRNKRFKSIGLIEFISFFISGVSSIILAYVLKSYIALVLQLLFYNILLLLGNLVVLQKNSSNFKLVELSDLSIKSSVSKIYKFSRNSSLFDITSFFNRNMDNFVIGKFFGSTSLGFYDRAYKLFLFPTLHITNLLNQIIHPLLVDYKDDLEFIYKKFLLFTRFLGLIGFPLSIFMFFSSNELILFLYGEKWLFAGEILKVLSIAVGFQMIATSGSVFFYTSHNTKLNLYGAIISFIINFVVVVLAVYLNSFTVVVYGLVVSFIINFIYVMLTINLLVFKKGILLFISSIRNTLIISVLMILSFVFITPYFTSNLLFNILLAFVSFSIGILVTSEYKWVLQNIKLIKKAK